MSSPDESRVPRSRGGKGIAFWTVLSVILGLALALLVFRDFLLGEWYMMRLAVSQEPDEQLGCIRGIHDLRYARAVPVLEDVVRSSPDQDVSLAAIDAIVEIKKLHEFDELDDTDRVIEIDTEKPERPSS